MADNDTGGPLYGRQIEENEKLTGNRKKLYKNFWKLNLLLYLCIRNNKGGQPHQNRAIRIASEWEQKENPPQLGFRSRPGGFPEQKNNSYGDVKYTTKEINHNYKIKVSGTYEGKKINTLVGVSGLVRLVGDIELTNRLLDRAFNDMTDCCVCKLRRGIKISFYVA